ncbi:MAG: cytochrome d ubiquinol oxidase subunit II [Balneolaceae bacterium]|nr:cytochrome d ubiquinol oxidase subunit II [Balneolaceae bacterium]
MRRQKSAFTKVARQLNVAAVIVGILVFATAEWEGLSLLSLFLRSWFSILMVLVATLLLPAIWWSLHRSKVIWSRVIAAGQVLCILLAWFWVQYPAVINLREGFPDLTFYNAAAPEATLIQLVWALVIGSCIILPFLFYLMKVFKGGQFGTENFKE